MRERNATLVVVTHDERIYKYAQRILNLEDGRLTHTITSPDFILSAAECALVPPDLSKECIA